MAMTRSEYWDEIRSTYKDPKDYVLAGKGNAYVRVDAEAKVTGAAVYTYDVFLPEHGIANSFTHHMLTL